LDSIHPTSISAPLAASAIPTSMPPLKTNSVHAPHDVFSSDTHANTEVIGVSISRHDESSYHGTLYLTNPCFRIFLWTKTHLATHQPQPQTIPPTCGASSPGSASPLPSESNPPRDLRRQAHPTRAPPPRTGSHPIPRRPPQLVRLPHHCPIRSATPARHPPLRLCHVLPPCHHTLFRYSPPRMHTGWPPGQKWLSHAQLPL
jgi:hypothetical protein